MHQLTQASTGHPINIGGLSVQGVMVLEDNGIIQGIVLGVNELGSKGVKTMVLETWVSWGHGERVAGRQSMLLSTNSI